MFPESEDKGALTAKEALPVMKLGYGGAYSQHSSINYILGPLICSGKIVFQPSGNKNLAAFSLSQLAGFKIKGYRNKQVFRLKI